MSVAETITQKLTRVLQPQHLDVINESHLHAGHRSSPGTGDSHFRIVVISEAFAGRNRVERHRMVNAALADELSGPVHALAITALAPSEA